MPVGQGEVRLPAVSTFTKLLVTRSFKNHSESLAAGALYPRQRAAVALVGDGAVFTQLGAIAFRTARAFDGHRRQALPILFGLGCKTHQFIAFESTSIPVLT